MVVLTLLVVLVAVIGGNFMARRVHQQKKNSSSSHNSSNNDIHVDDNKEINNDGSGVVYVIGDLHGDYDCTKYWVNRTGLISSNSSNNDRKKKQQQWIDSRNKLVFLGDYIDKGIQCKQTLEYVKELTELFPNHVTALLGNHEVELLLDRDGMSIGSWGGGAFYQLPYASLHPGELYNYIPPTKSTEGDDDAISSTMIEKKKKNEYEIVIDALHNASIEVYGHNDYSNTFIASSSSSTLPKEKTIVKYIEDDEIRQLVEKYLPILQENYINTFKSDTILGKWIEELSILHIANGVLLVHGGVSITAAQYINDIGKLIVDDGDSGSGRSESTIKTIERINNLFKEHSSQDKLRHFLHHTKIGQMIYHELLTFRGNHPSFEDENENDNDDGHASSSQCQQLINDILPLLNNNNSNDKDSDNDDDNNINNEKRRQGRITKIGVGHTPGYNVRMYCNGTFMALDSMLGKYIRHYGNNYCDGKTTKTSSNSMYTCNKMLLQQQQEEKENGVDNDDDGINSKQCHGQIIKILPNSNIEIITQR